MTAGRGMPEGGKARLSGHLLLGWLAYLAFVIYGSLVPLDFHPMPLDQAWAKFQQIPMLQLGVENRADWVANGVLYVPVGFLTVALFGSQDSLWRRLPQLVGTILFAFALAVGVEFAQVFFPPRTVSRNDVIAEWIGSLLGIALAMYWADWFHRVLAALSGKLDQVVAHGLQLYAVGYLAFSFFPYDFLLSATELGDKFRSDAWGAWLAVQSSERGLILLVAKLLAEVLAMLPLGVMLGRWNAARHMPVTRNAWLLGGLLGLAIEVGQFFIYTGVSQGASLLTRALGMYAGAVLWRERGQLSVLGSIAHGSKLWISVGLYGLALVAVNGWFDHDWHGWSAAGAALAETRFLPFYYHYFTTEQAALLSLVSVAFMYAPLGVLAWLRRWSAGIATVLAALLACGVEVSKLFLQGMHADPTNALIAALSAWSVVQLAGRVGRDDTLATEPEAAPRVMANAGMAVVVVLGLVVWAAADFPVGALPLAVTLLGYAVLLWFHPHSMWIAIPAALPLLDLAPWSGRFYFDEFDFLILVSLTIGFARTQAPPRDRARDGGAVTMTVLVALVFAIGTVRGLLPWQWPDLNSFSNYYSPWNALRLAKGAIWTLLLIALLPRFAAGGRDVRPLFATGMVIGLAGTVAVVIWERLAFPGLFDFADVYRVTGPFSAMHVGGADLEVFLTAAVPFALLFLTGAASRAVRIGAGLILLAATYTLMVTFSRAGYAGFVVAVIVALLFAAKVRWHGAAWCWITPAAVVTAALAIAVPIYSGSFAQERVSQSGKDLGTRVAHWKDTLALRDRDWATELFGMGLGRFPETHYWRSAETRAGGYRLMREGDNVFLRLGAGYPLYVEQIVAAEPQRDYRLRLSVRSARSDAGVSVALCEKWLLTSGQCVSQSLAGNGDKQAWQSHEVTLASGAVGSGKGWVRPPVKLSFSNASAASVDIDNLELIGPDGVLLLANGNFRRGMDHWFFSADQDLPWHVWSLPVAVLFELGWFGLLALGAVVLWALRRQAQAAWGGDAAAAASLAALTGLLVIAGVDTVIDGPRILLLFGLMISIVVVRNRNPLVPTVSSHS